MGRYRNAIPSFAVAFVCYVRGAAVGYDSCNNGTVIDIGNGRCDAALNTAVCGFDGGDVSLSQRRHKGGFTQRAYGCNLPLVASSSSR